MSTFGVSTERLNELRAQFAAPQNPKGSHTAQQQSTATAFPPASFSAETLEGLRDAFESVDASPRKSPSLTAEKTARTAQEIPLKPTWETEGGRIDPERARYLIQNFQSSQNLSESAQQAEKRVDPERLASFQDRVAKKHDLTPLLWGSSRQQPASLLEQTQEGRETEVAQTKDQLCQQAAGKSSEFQSQLNQLLKEKYPINSQKVKLQLAQETFQNAQDELQHVQKEIEAQKPAYQKLLRLGAQGLKGSLKLAAGLAATTIVASYTLNSACRLSPLETTEFCSATQASTQEVVDTTTAAALAVASIWVKLFNSASAIFSSPAPEARRSAFGLGVLGL